MTDWFRVDKEGLGRQAAEFPKGRLIAELIQNSLDETGVTMIEVRLNPIPGKPFAEVMVGDDSPEGFRNLAHAYTLYADSYKATDPTKRGRFNLGEKLVLALCRRATITTTKGRVEFSPMDGRVELRHKREKGSVFIGEIRMTREECQQAGAYLRTLLIPSGVLVVFNDGILPSRKPLHAFTADLSTLVADEDGIMRERTRQTTIRVYEPTPGEVATLYELGLPVVETGDKWHVDIGQRVPLNRDRDNVKPSFLAKVRTLVVNEMHDRLAEDDANQTWVRQASASPDCSQQATGRILDLRFGEKRVAYDPSDPEANKAAVAQNYTVVHGGMMHRQEWTNAKAAGAIRPAGKVCPTAKPYSDDPNAPPADILPQDEWTPGMHRIVAYARFLARQLMDVQLTVTIVRAGMNFSACYGKGGRLDLNLKRLGHRFFDEPNRASITRLLIHEFGHEYSGDHLSEAYHDALCDLGAKLLELALSQPKDFPKL